MKKRLVVKQEGNKDCGSACLLSIVRYFGGDISLDRLIEMTKTSKSGTNFYNISKAALELGIISKGYKVDDILKLKQINPPFICQFNNKNCTHFVVVYRVNNNKITIMDPAKGRYNIDIFDFSNSWTGYILLFEKYSTVPYFKDDKNLNLVIKKTIYDNKKLILILVILSFIFTIFSCITSFYSQIFFDEIINTTLSNLTIITIIFSILFIIKNITSFIRNHLLIYLNQKLDISIMISSFSKVILLPYNYYKNKTTSEVLSRLNDLSYLKNFISKIIISIFLDLFVFIISSIIIYSINYKVFLMFMIIALIYFIVLLAFNSIVRKFTIINQENNSLINNTILESVSLFETVKGLNIEDNIILRFAKIYSNTLNSYYSTEKINNILLFIKDIITDIGLLLVNFIIFRYIMNDILSIGNFMTISFLSWYLISPVGNLVNILNEYHYFKNTIKRGNSMLGIDEDKIYESRKINVTGNIVVKNLDYTFNNKNYILKNINLYIKSGERVLMLGDSGSGKSTFLKILYKYLEVDRNKIFINNYDINDYSLSDIRSDILYISQNEMIFTGSIRDNIILDRNIGEIDYLNICKLLHIDDIVKDNILGYDYLLEENGVNISGGQRQRIILARSLLKNSNIIIIDEGFNQIDIKLERDLLINIFEYFYDKTFIIVSHRTENNDLFDKVIKFNKGIVESVEERLIR